MTSIRDQAKALDHESGSKTPRGRVQHIFEVLRERICLLDYKPGEIIKERELAVEFRVSRTPVRQAIQRLESDGLTVSRQGLGTVITDIDLESLKDIYFLRIKLAAMIGESRPWTPAPEIFKELGVLKRKCRLASNSAPDHRLFAEINIGLHKQYQSVIRNKQLREISDKLFYLTARMWFQLLPKLVWKEEIEDLDREITAVDRYFGLNDVESAGYVHRNHLSMVVRRLDSLI